MHGDQGPVDQLSLVEAAAAARWIAQQLQKSVDAGHWVAQIMSEQFREIVFHAVEPAQLGELSADEFVLATNAKEGANAQQKLAPIDGLGEEIVRSAFKTLMALFRCSGGGEQQHWKKRLTEATLDLATKPSTVGIMTSSNTKSMDCVARIS